MNKERENIINFALSLEGAMADKPFPEDFDTTVLRHAGTGKWFGIIMHISGNKVGLSPDIKVDVMNVKCKPEDTFTAREISSGILPAYHMNKKHWNQINLFGVLPDGLVQHLIRHSYSEVVKKLPRKLREGLELT
jgi:predicted DNA-binding protein (MmcQ/YjbR family)